MRIRNTTQRNIRLLASYQYTKDVDTGEVLKGNQGPQITGTPYKILIPAGSSLELSDLDWGKVSKSAEGLIELGYLTFLERPVSPLTRAQIIERVSEVAKVDLNPKASKAELMKRADQLNVDVWKPAETGATEISSEVLEAATKEMDVLVDSIASKKPTKEISKEISKESTKESSKESTKED